MSKKTKLQAVDALKGCLRYKKQHLLITNFNFHKQIWEFLGKTTPFALHWFAFYIWRVMFCYLLTQGRAREGGREAWRGHGGRERESHLISPGETLNTISASDQTRNKTTKKIILNNLLIKSVSLFWPRGRVGWQRGMISLGGSRSSEVPALCGMWHCDGDSEVT